MKKLLSVLLVLAMMLSLFACGGDPCDVHTDADNDGVCDICMADVKKNCTSHTDADSNGLCDVCSAVISCEHKDENGDNKCDGCGAAMDSVVVNAALALSKNIKAQLDAAASFAVDFTVDILTEEDDCYLDENDEYVKDTYYSEGTVSGTAVFAKTTTGTDVVVSLKAVARESAEDEFEETFNANFLYIKDGVAYVYGEDGVYAKTDLFTGEEFEDLEDTLADITEGVAPTNAQLNAALESIGEALMEGLSIKDGKGELKIDMKPGVESLQAYFAELDVETDTLGDVIDDLLATVDPELTAEDLVTLISDSLGSTVSEALADIDAYLTENYETTLQGIYDGIVADPAVITLLTNILEAYVEDTGDEAMDIAEVLEEIKAFKIADLVEESGMGEVVLYDLIISMIAGESEEEPPALEDLVEMANAYLAMTLAEFEELVGPYISMYKEDLAMLKVNTLDTTVSVSFKDIFKIDTLSVVSRVDAALTREVTDEMDEVEKLKLTVTLTVRDISTEAKTVTLPEDMVAAYQAFLNEDLFYADEDCWDTYDYARFYYSYDEDDNMVYELRLYLADGTLVVAEGIDLSVMGSTTVTVAAADLTVDGEPLTGTDLVLEFNMDTEEVHVVSAPNLP